MRITSELQDQIDLLVDGELDERDRHSLLTTLEADRGNGGWRACALALLESRELTQAFEEETEALPNSKVTNLRLLRSVAAIAAVVCAFVLGWMMNQQPAQQDPRLEIVEEVKTPGNPAQPEESTPLILPVPQPPIVYYRMADGSDGYYATRYELPTFIVHALQDSGHQVLRVQRSVEIDHDSGETKVYPITETRIIEARQL